jgi:hypothetical protein
VLTLSKCFHDESKAEEGEEDAIQFFEAGEDAAIAFESSKEPLEFVPLSVERAVIAPGINSIGFRRDDRHHAEFQPKLASLILPS